MRIHALAGLMLLFASAEASAQPFKTPSIILFSGEDYSGPKVWLNADAAQLKRVPPLEMAFNGRANSIHALSGEWQLCDGNNFTGNCITIHGRIPRLDSIGFGNRIRSVRLVTANTEFHPYNDITQPSGEAVR